MAVRHRAKLSFTYKGRAVDVKQVGRELGVRYVLEGSVRRSGNRIRITGQLIDALSGRHIWAERFDRELTAIFELQDEITQRVVAATEPNVRSVEIERSSRKPTDSLDAYDLYLRALPEMYPSLKRVTFRQTPFYAEQPTLIRIFLKPGRRWPTASAACRICGGGRTLTLQRREPATP